MKTLEFNLLIAVLGVAALNAQSQTPTARLSARMGSVEVQRGNAWLPVSPGDALNVGERVRTTAGSSAAIEIGPNKVITLNEVTEVQVRESNGSPIVQLERGSMKVFSASEIQVGAKDTMLESAEKPLDMELGYQADRLNLTVFNGAVRNGPVVVHAPQDSNTRTYTAGGRGQQRNGYVIANPTVYVYPYFLYGTPDPNEGRIVAPIVNNPTNPGYRPTQVVPPMSDPIRVPVMPRR